MQLLATVLADVAEMPRSALLPIHLQPLLYPLLSAFLCWGASVFEGIREPLGLSLILALAYLSVYSCSMSRTKTSLAPTTHEEARIFVRVKFMAPLMLAWLLGRVPLPLPASVG